MKLLAISLAVAIALAAGAAPAARANAETPEQFVERTSNEVLSILRNTSLAHDAKIARLEAMMDERSDFETISKLVLASHYRQFSDAQKKDFVELLHRYLTTTYGQQIDNYGNESFTIAGGRPEARGDYTVVTRIHRQAGAELSVEYRVRKVGEDWRLIDVIGEGISLVSNLRSQFGEILSAGGPDKLLAVLREKNAAGKPADLPLAKPAAKN
jgi:phospholipid transport system substrate-binding protein